MKRNGITTTEVAIALVALALFAAMFAVGADLMRLIR
jgi:hypothetical protein